MTLTLYHGTDSAYLPSIEQEGLIPHRRKGNDTSFKSAKGYDALIPERRQSVYLSMNPNVAADFAKRIAGEKGTILTIKLPVHEARKLRVDEAGGFLIPGMALRYPGQIKTRWIASSRPVTDEDGFGDLKEKLI